MRIEIDVGGTNTDAVLFGYEIDYVPIKERLSG